MDVSIERCAGLDVHKNRGCVHPYARGRREAPPKCDSHLSNHDDGAEGAAGVAGRERGDARGDGVDRGVLVPGSRGSRGTVHAAVGQRAPRQAGARSQDGREGTPSGWRGCWSAACSERASSRRRRSGIFGI